MRIDPLEELRELDGIARRQSGRRDVFAVDDLLAIGSAGGGRALGLESWPDVAVDVGHPQLAGVDDWRNALVAGCSADVLRTPLGSGSPLSRRSRMTDEHHFTIGPAGDELWSTPEEERTFRLVRDLLMEMRRTRLRDLHHAGARGDAGRRLR